ncbi:MAG TPA: hypothetical protein PKK10_18925, partial [Woeseiaceae bacterium]|nr:hypothetical protein [Woeseiaceae bacterium]
WAELQWPEHAPRSVGELAARVSEPLSGELSRLSRASYGGGAAAFDGAQLAKAIRSFAVVAAADSSSAPRDILPPLSPG